MQIIDVVIVCLVLLIAEKNILKDKYILLSPYTMMILSLIFIYVIPIILYYTGTNINIIRYLDKHSIEVLLLYTRLFIYSFAIFEIVSLNLIKKKSIEIKKAKYAFNKDFMIILALFSFVIVFGTQLLIVNFNIPIFIDKLINPRMYTYYKESLGPLTYLIEVTKKVYLFASLVYFIRNKNRISIFFVVTSTILNILGGTKTSIIIILIFYVLVWQKFSRNKINISFFKIAKLGSAMIILLLIAFLTMSQNDESLSSAIEAIISYPQEAYYSSQVIRDFDPQLEHHIEIIRSFIFTPIPRAIYSGKDYYGFYANYWRPIYQPNTVIYHTSTYGLFAEGQMLFGILSTIVYSIILNILLYKTYIKFYLKKNITQIFFNIFIISQIYFFMRVGLFDASLLWSLILHYIGANILFKIPIGKKIKIED